MTTHAQTRRDAGFTLIELMIVVALTGILVAIAVPTYQDSVRKSRRGQAQADLVEAAQALERYYTVNGKYTGKTLKEIAGFDQSPRADGTAHYSLSLQADTRSYTVTATPSSDSSQSQDKCGTMSVDATGKKTAKSTDYCWK